LGTVGVLNAKPFMVKSTPLDWLVYAGEEARTLILYAEPVAVVYGIVKLLPPLVEAVLVPNKTGEAKLPVTSDNCVEKVFAAPKFEVKV
jgi:hypothetical protein